MRSDVIKTGPDRAPARAMLHATGLDEAAIRKPLVAVVHTWSNVSPCNLNLRDLAQHVARRRACGGRHADRVQHDRGHRRHRDGHAGHARVAGQPRGDHRFDRTRGRRSLRSTRWSCCAAATRRFPPRRWRWRASTFPASRCTAAASRTARSTASRSRSSRCSRRSARTARARSTTRELHEVESRACPGAGACGGQFTANTMAMVLTALGLSPLGYNDIAATDPAKARRRAPLRRTRGREPASATCARATC